MKITDPITMEETEVINGIVLIRVNTKDSIEQLDPRTGQTGETGETLLVRREGDKLMFLNNTRHLSKCVKNEYYREVTRARIFYVRCDGRGYYKGFDYRGVDVLLCFRYIPQPKWGLIVKWMHLRHSCPSWN